MQTSLGIRELLGKEVIGIRGWRIGLVTDVILDPKTWGVIALDVRLPKNVAEEFGLRHMLRSARIPVDVQNVQGIGDAAITLKISKAELRTFLRAKPAADDSAKVSEGNPSDQASVDKM